MKINKEGLNDKWTRAEGTMNALWKSMRALRTQTERFVNGERERNGVESESEHIMDVLLAHRNKIKKKNGSGTEW